MPASGSRDLTTTRHAVATWLATHLAAVGVRATDLAVDLDQHRGGGHSNEILFVTARYRSDGIEHEDRLVLRLPPAGPALFARYDLMMQVAVQDAVRHHGVPVPHPVTLVTDPNVLGTPFLVMPRVVGHDLGEVPAADPWITAATAEQQRAVHEGFLDALAGVHTTPWERRPVAGNLRGAAGSLADEIDWWEHLVAWIFGGSPPARFRDLFTWCRDNRPPAIPSSILWGDVRLGNVIIDDRFTPIALLDWEMASIGPAEMDVAWYTALEAMTEHFVGRRVPGFLTRDEIAARHERALGRPLVDLPWFEVFAMTRSAALNIRADRLEAHRRGKEPRPAEQSAVLAYATDAMVRA